MGIRKTLIANTQPFDAFEGAEKIWTFKRMIYWRNEADGHFLKAAKPLREETLSHAKIWSATFFKKSTPKKNLVTLFFCPRPWDFCGAYLQHRGVSLEQKMASSFASAA